MIRNVSGCGLKAHSAGLLNACFMTCSCRLPYMGVCVQILACLLGPVFGIEYSRSDLGLADHV